jgi:hypothetical protein
MGYHDGRMGEVDELYSPTLSRLGLSLCDDLRATI